MTWMRTHLDRRGKAMAVMGAVWLIFGYYVEMGAGSTPDGAPHATWPEGVRAIDWAASGALALVSVAARPVRSWALACLAIMPLIRVVSYTWAWAAWWIPGSPPGTEFAPYSIAHYAVFLGWIAWVATERDSAAETFRVADALTDDHGRDDR